MRRWVIFLGLLVPSLARGDARVDQVLAEVAELDATRRGPMAVIAPRLTALGPDVRWALAEKIRAGAPDGLTETARLAWDVGLIEAAGSWREPGLISLWIEILDGPEPRFDVRRAAAEALARLDDPGTARLLVARAAGPGADAVLAGMGHCRRVACARTLAAAVSAVRADPTRARPILRALSEMGSSWAWATPRLRGRADEAEVRRIVSHALLRVLVSSEGEVRQAASNALVVIEVSDEALAAAGARASAEARAVLAAVAARLRRR